jgi:ppGpp synthetase/RelA/SpoT-type nucleotidyltranferase
MAEEKAVKWYKENQTKYKKLSRKVEKIIKRLLEDKDIYYHSIENRAKSIESFRRKAKKDKYKKPLKEITDLAGVRIITLFEKDVYEISDLIKEVFKIDYVNSEDKADLLDADKMGYKSVHYIGTLTDELIDLKEFDIFTNLKFEIQIRSILQHAWAEIEHDRNYKLKGNLPKHLQRRFYSLSGMLEMADREFNLLAKEVDDYKEKVKQITRNGEIDIKTNKTSLQKYLLAEFRTEIKEDIIEPTFESESESNNILKELDRYGIWDLVKLDSIIPEEVHDVILKKLDSSSNLSFISLLRLLMIINDHRKYFEKVWKRDFNILDKDSEIIMKKYKVPIKKLAEEYEFNIENR